MIGLLFGALGLAACGRKGGLDSPPGGASLAQEPAPGAPGLRVPIGGAAATPIGGQAAGGNAGVGADGRALAAPGPKKRIPLDVLLD
jgi:hypothetical protein